MGIINQIAQLLFSLSLLIVLHELGHFIPAKLFKTRVEKFYLFFNPWCSLFKKKVGETTYGIGWLPLGGYVKIAGMIDESMDKEAMEKPPEPWEFRSKPAWQRLIIMLGGVTVNVILAIVIYIGVMFVYGRTYIENSSLEDGIAVVNQAVEEGTGFRTGDKIVSIDGKSVREGDFSRVMQILFFAEEVELERDGKVIKYDKPESTFKTLLQYKDSVETPLIYHRYPFYVDSVIPNSNASTAGLMKNDRILTLNGETITYFDQFQRILLEAKPDKVALTVKRGNDTLALSSAVTKGKLGFQPAIDKEHDKCFEIKHDSFSFGKSMVEGYQEAKFQLWFYYLNFKQLFNFKSEAYKGVGGFKAYPSFRWRACDVPVLRNAYWKETAREIDGVRSNGRDDLIVISGTDRQLK